MALFIVFARFTVPALPNDELAMIRPAASAASMGSAGEEKGLRNFPNPAKDEEKCNNSTHTHPNHSFLTGNSTSRPGEGFGTGPGPPKPQKNKKK